MGTLGKILLFVNFVAFGGLFYFATQDWSARQAAAANALKHQLVISGMPVTAPSGIDGDADNIALGTTVSGFYPVQAVRPSLLKEVFAGTGSEEYSGGDFPKTQLEQIDTSRKKLDALLAGLAPAEQITKLGGTYTADAATGRVVFTPGLLTLLAESYTERTLIRKLADPAGWVRQPDRKEANAKTLLDLLARRLDALSKVDAKQADVEAAAVKEATEVVRLANDDAKKKFNASTALSATPDADPQAITAAANTAAAALDKLNETYAALQTVLSAVGTTACRDEGDRRRRIAHLLMHLSESAGWQKRVALTVGLRTYLSAMSDQANRLQKMAGSAEQQIVLDQARFADEYELLKNLAIGQSLLLKSQIGVRADLQFQRSKDEEAANQRRALLEDRRKTLEATQARVTAALASQSETEQRLFAVQKLTGETLRKTFDLEEKLEAAEAPK